MSAPNIESFETLDSLKSLLGNELKPILVSYCYQTPRTLTKLKRAVKTGDLEKIQNLAHLLKGSSSNLGFVKFSNDCNQLEQAAKNQADFIELEALNSQLIKDEESINARIEEFIIENF
ncbi:Hpt domain-containing protein [Thiomicrospira cyclica]|uniref:Hpt domain protein n=1 Tax=Thiomicrospira cyclica (strain DSM 14477 / JCM 11371 / ALM1) TaxID=717773 RepID=F6DB67_THICA|nr:Hpt domain-containing protein [Thiomicrospira cyclica]AEG30807.1 Hpt domain protein [Thiomicrospira cyclica ALM1]